VYVRSCRGERGDMLWSQSDDEVGAAKRDARAARRWSQMQPDAALSGVVFSAQPRAIPGDGQGIVKMVVGVQSAHAVPSFVTLYMACTPCTASTPHAAWVIDRSHPGAVADFQVKARNAAACRSSRRHVQAVLAATSTSR
jgi:hypothetical protein